MSELKVLKNNAIAAYNKAGTEGKTLLTNLFGNEVFSQKITDRVKTFQDVLDIKDISEAEFEASCSGMSADEKAYKQVKLIAEVLNEGWKPNWNDGSQYKYYPYFDMRNGLSYYGYFFDGQCSSVGSRLCFRSSEIAEYAGTQFLDIYKAFLTI